MDPRKPEKGVYAASFDIPTECSCSVVKYDEILISTAVGRKPDEDGGAYVTYKKTYDSILGLRICFLAL